MFVYQSHSDHDLLLVQWWAELKTSGELSLITFKVDSLASFFDLFNPPNSLLLECNAAGTVCFAAWFEPCFSGAFLGIWVHSALRRTRAAHRLFGEAARLGFQHYNLLLGVTKQPKLISLHEHLGYKLLSPIPQLWNGETAYLMLLSPETLFVDQRKR